ncbi:F0F1 ATP synthase subunit gamma [Candidatus Amesbacteria bacterium]|nr:F0F1 ATP synthase subunit gamma [Candidatus Amesbacteria bacterium]
MINKRWLKGEREGMTGLRSLVEIYQEVAAARMKKVRGDVLASRQFLEEMLGVFGQVRQAYKKSGRSGLAKSGRTVAVFLSANSGLYGDIVDRTFEKFAGHIRSQKCEAVVVGKLGARMMADSGMNKLYNYYDFPDDKVEPESLWLIMRYLLQFERIVVFYGKFGSILIQDPVMTTVSGENLEGVSAEEKIEYIFEPTIEDIAKIFEGQILTSLFEQTLHESQLAKFASRFLNLDRSWENIGERLELVGREEVRLRRKTRNQKQLSTISGMSLWWKI